MGFELIFKVLELMFMDLELIFIDCEYIISSKEKTFPPRRKNIFSVKEKLFQHEAKRNGTREGSVSLFVLLNKKLAITLPALSRQAFRHDAHGKLS